VKNTTENSIKTVHKLQLQFKQFNQFISSVRSFRQFVIHCYCCHQNTVTKGVRYNSLSYPLFIVTCFKLAHRLLRPKKEKRKTFSCVRACVRACVVLFFVKRQTSKRTSNCVDYTTYLHLLQIESSSSDYFHRKIGFSNSGLFVN